MAHRTIVLQGTCLTQEKICKVVVAPGSLVERTSDDKIQPHSAAGGKAAVTVAKEDSLQGKGVNDSYEAGSICLFSHFKAGERFAALVAGTVAIGDFLVSDGTGKMKKATTAAEKASAVAVAIEAGSDQLIAAEAI